MQLKDYPTDILNSIQHDNGTDEVFQSEPAGYQDLKDRVDLAESETQDVRNHAIHLANALMDVNNVTGHDGHVKRLIEEVDSLMREYAGLEIK